MKNPTLLLYLCTKYYFSGTSMTHVHLIELYAVWSDICEEIFYYHFRQSIPEIRTTIDTLSQRMLSDSTWTFQTENQSNSCCKDNMDRKMWSFIV